MSVPKDTKLIFIGVSNLLLCSRKVNDQVGLKKSMFWKLLNGQGCTEKYYMVDIILYNPEKQSDYMENFKPFISEGVVLLIGDGSSSKKVKILRDTHAQCSGATPSFSC